ncbi:MAG: alpha/beta fold hydrolase [bacterium]|nr:alpha/beta fold hydrolase [bacterium]
MGRQGQQYLSSQVLTAWPVNNRIPFLHFRPRRHGRTPALILLHGYGMCKEHLRLVATLCCWAGCSVMVPDLPLHGSRGPLGRSGADQLLLTMDLKNCSLLFRQAAADVVACLDWLCARPEVDPRRLALVGFSLGGILTALVLGMDGRPRAGVSLVGGGDLAGIIFSSPAAAPLRARLEALGYGPDQVREHLRDVNPLTYADRVANLLMINGERDRIVPPEAVLRFWSALDPSRDNRLVWGPWGHFLPPWPTFRQVLGHLRLHLEDGAAGELPPGR